jgi:hypothetical protein
MGFLRRIWAWLRNSPVSQLKEPRNWSTWQDEERANDPPSEAGTGVRAREPRD